MSGAVEVVVQVLLLVVGVWILFMGGMGATIAKVRGGSPLEGFLWGVLLGPLGWAAVLWRTRGAAGERVSAAEWLRAEEAGATSGSSVLDELYGPS